MPALQTILSELKEGLSALYGERLVRVVLYGSQARGDAGEDSDIDVLVVLKGSFNRSAEIKRTSHLVAGLSLAHDTLISRLFISKPTFRWCLDEQVVFLAC